TGVQTCALPICGGGEPGGGVGEQRVALVDEVVAAGGDLLGDRGGGGGDGLLALGAGAAGQAVAAHLEVREIRGHGLVGAGAEHGHVVALGAQRPDHLLDVHGGSLGAEHPDAGVEQGVGDPHDWLLPTGAAGSSADGEPRGDSGAAGAGSAGSSAGSASSGLVRMLRCAVRSARARRRRACARESYCAATSSRAASVRARRSVAGSSASRTAACSAAGSPVGTSQPVRPSRITSPTAVTDAATQGMPIAIASSST